MTQADLFTKITPTARMSAISHGGRAKCLQRLVRLDLPVPPTVAMSFDGVRAMATGHMDPTQEILDLLDNDVLCCARPSSESADWGGPSAILNIGMNDARYVTLSEALGKEAATRLYCRFVRTYAIQVARLDPDMFEGFDEANPEALRAMLEAFELEMDEPFPQSRSVQLRAVLQSMAKAWDGTTARLLRQAKGAPADAGLGLVVQQMALGIGEGLSGSGVIQYVNSQTGQAAVEGRFLEQSQGREALRGDAQAYYIETDARGPALEDVVPEITAQLRDIHKIVRRRLREEMQLEFTLENGVVHLLDGVRVDRNTRAAVEIVVALAKDEIIDRREAIMRIDPTAISELLHRQVAPTATRDIIGQGIAASPGAATGKIVFSAAEAQSCAARDEACILVRPETTPEDIRGMHAARGVLTARGGLTSHAAVIGRGIGVPCVVGVSDMVIDHRLKTLSTQTGVLLSEGDLITIDGTQGHVLAGAPDMIEAALNDALQELLLWADDFRDIAVRANADTPKDAQTARNFGAEGIGLCRTEHMFFEEGRLDVMREMIFARKSQDRKAVLERLLPMQRADFAALFEIMDGHPVCIRLFDPPLHEFLPTSRADQRNLAAILDLPNSEVVARIEELHEHNPMLGLRGVRLGVTVPEIYDMQARAIFEATLDARDRGAQIVPEIMIPLVSAQREVELVKRRIDAVAQDVKSERKRDFNYRLGVMVETPRAALRAGDIAEYSAFLSFGTNDLTQMTYGLSRDDAGRFMGEYVQAGVYPEDPFHTFDVDGVGELVSIAAARGRAHDKKIVLSICGEHGGQPDAISFCRSEGFDYVSCSPFRVPVARLIAAHFAISDLSKGV